MITISVKLYLSLKRHTKTEDNILNICVNEGITIREVFDMIGLIPGEVGVIRLNGKVVKEGETIVKKSTLEALPIFGGG